MTGLLTLITGPFILMIALLSEIPGLFTQMTGFIQVVSQYFSGPKRVFTLMITLSAFTTDDKNVIIKEQCLYLNKSFLQDSHWTALSRAPWELSRHVKFTYCS